MAPRIPLIVEVVGSPTEHRLSLIEEQSVCVRVVPCGDDRWLLSIDTESRADLYVEVERWAARHGLQLVRRLT